MLNHVQQPEYRQLVVELLSIVSTILTRNPELTFNEPLDLEVLIKDAAHMYAKVSNFLCQQYKFLNQIYFRIRIYRKTIFAAYSKFPT